MDFAILILLLLGTVFTTLAKREGVLGSICLCLGVMQSFEILAHAARQRLDLGPEGAPQPYNPVVVGREAEPSFSVWEADRLRNSGFFCCFSSAPESRSQKIREV